ncbi:MAG: hypothetical protein ACYS5F_12365 [Planctomycetota bacterium]
MEDRTLHEEQRARPIASDGDLREQCRGPELWHRRSGSWRDFDQYDVNHHNHERGLANGERLHFPGIWLSECGDVCERQATQRYWV